MAQLQYIAPYKPCTIGITFSADGWPCILTLEYICLQFHNAKHFQQRSTGDARAGR